MNDNTVVLTVPPHFHHNTTSPQSVCQTCHRQFTRVRNLRRHITTVHDRSQSHVCRICHRSFQRPSDLRSHERIHLLRLTADASQDHRPMIAYQRDRAYQRVKVRFQNEFSTHFPDTPCAYCGTLLLPRNISWISAEDDRVYPIEEILQRSPQIRIIAEHSEVAVCKKCRFSPQEPIAGGPWPMMLLELPQHSRMFLSPLTINTNLGRTQGAQVHLNPYTTYRTVTGERFLIFHSLF